jgi:hypothetical protein
MGQPEGWPVSFVAIAHHENDVKNDRINNKCYGDFSPIERLFRFRDHSTAASDLPYSSVT